MCFVEYIVIFVRYIIAIIAANRGEKMSVFYSNMAASQNSQINFPVEVF